MKTTGKWEAGRGCELASTSRDVDLLTVTAQSDIGRTTVTLCQAFKNWNHVEETRYGKPRSQVKLETHSLDLSKYFLRISWWGAPTHLLKYIPKSIAFMGKCINTAWEQMMDLQDQELGGIVDRVFLGWLTRIKTFLGNSSILVKCLHRLGRFPSISISLGSLSHWLEINIFPKILSPRQTQRSSQGSSRGRRGGKGRTVTQRSWSKPSSIPAVH